MNGKTCKQHQPRTSKKRGPIADITSDLEDNPAEFLTKDTDSALAGVPELQLCISKTNNQEATCRAMRWTWPCVLNEVLNNADFMPQSIEKVGIAAGKMEVE